jgi:hypothetical protein
MPFACPTPGASNGGPNLTITRQPVSQTVNAGSPASLSVNVSGGGPFSFEWRHDSVPVPGGTNATLVFPAAQLQDAGNYQVIITNTCTVLTSAVATLTVLAPPQLGANPAFGANGFEFLLFAQPGQQYFIEKSTNLVDWTVFSTVSPTATPWPVQDPTATREGTAFYRARLQWP